MANELVNDPVNETDESYEQRLNELRAKRVLERSTEDSESPYCEFQTKLLRRIRTLDAHFKSPEVAVTFVRTWIKSTKSTKEWSKRNSLTRGDSFRELESEMKNIIKIQLKTPGTRSFTNNYQVGEMVEELNVLLVEIVNAGCILQDNGLWHIPEQEQDTLSRWIDPSCLIKR